MGSFIIEGRNSLEGIVDIGGSKNAALPILASTVISGREYLLENIPDIEDVKDMLEILQDMGCTVQHDNGVALIDTRGLNTSQVPEKLVRKIRSSIILMGAVLQRTGNVEIAYPGGCEIGLRPIDLHLKGLRKLGVEIIEKSGLLVGKVTEPSGCEIQLDYPSVGATENIMLFAVGIPGKTVIYNPAKEPEIVDLQNFLNTCGYSVSGAGTGSIIIEGKKPENTDTVEYKIISDRIEAGTYLSAASSMKSKIYIRNIEKSHFKSITSIYEDAGCEIRETHGTIVISNQGRIKAVEKVTTQPYPGFPTDMQAQFMASMATADGISIIEETVFDSRYKHVPELQKMGANITTIGRVAVVEGVHKLYSAEVEAKDLRGGAALVIAALGAEGTSKINNIYHINRGYEKFVQKLQNIGAVITETKN
ncbi:UDP-N-acetylglucosamine 1-carboxyvinyltransferase [bioreactor metagenome]|jgi:UDP-N-acetylglucosamine 1-carboxyvinyltransferase|uniref:UDP-N-acetylglucosamine 1-carboxyvinyltransferase n=2 Tax=root TaxID=1 RepID=A0A562J226_9FIRM|nr:UDP-N-acetylglucosamine 1-carboxyvinyltransferase [Sedimentibacter saalensis]MEA5096117.1 UDP-N-acetylglucosamine 1-carboxyvinyltransferase [Sedimentibacter saalensis]TWH76934.1 UDP-N-acetylglucosamine 1-carboxyvinyltransferase [Sedimentibacter saalensis]